MTIRLEDALVLLLLVVLIALVMLTPGCGPMDELPKFGASVHNQGVDVEQKQELTRNEEGWVQGREWQFRVVGNDALRVEWRAAVSNITDMPRRASARVVFSCNNPAPKSNEAITLEDNQRTILPPRSAGWVSGSIPVPADIAALVAGAKDKSGILLCSTIALTRPSAEPQKDGPIKIRCVSVKDGRASMEWTATGQVREHTITARAKNCPPTTVKIAPVSVKWRIEMIGYGKAIYQSNGSVIPEADGSVRASGAMDIGLDDAADIEQVKVMWEGVYPETSAVERKKTIRARVTAYCPCARCCGRMTGITADGSTAWRPGVATDWRYWPAGTSFSIPGYGRASIVYSDDTGRLVRGPEAIDVRMDYHWQAREWGVQWLDVEVHG